MTTASDTGQLTGTKDKNYNLIWYTEQCLDNALRMENYVQDAERDGDNELADLFRKAQAASKKGAEEGKRLSRTGSVSRLSPGGSDAERVAVGIGEHDPFEIAETAPPGLAGAELHQPLDLRLHVSGGEVDVQTVLAGRRVVDLLKRQPRPLGTGDGDEKRWCDGVYLPIQSAGPPVGESFGVSAVEGDVLCFERHAPTLDQAGDKTPRDYFTGN